MRILFLARHYSYLRLFESAIAGLAERGQAAHRGETMGGRQMVEGLAERYPGVTLGTVPGRAAGPWAELARRLRLGLDYLRYLDPRYSATSHLVTRSRSRAPRIVVWLSGL